MRSSRYLVAALFALVALVVLVLILATHEATGAESPALVPMTGSNRSWSTEAAGSQEDRRSRIRSVICSVFTGTRCGPAIRVATCETGGTLDPHAEGSAGERGLFQIHPVHFKSLIPHRLWEPLYNTRVAFRLSRGGRSWRPWTCRP